MLEKDDLESKCQEKSQNFELWRQDDTGNRFLIKTFVSEEEALKQLLIFEQRGHKQFYEVKRKSDEPFIQ